MKLIADSGSTKTDWSLLDEKGKVVATCYSQGLNPYHLSDEEILCVLQEKVNKPLLARQSVSSVFFYGSGVTDAMVPRMEKLLLQVFQDAEVHAASDMLGAARALLGHDAGIAVILGTGSNSCLYDGKELQSGVSPLGYILGDEGSGTAIGKTFFRLIYRNPAASSLREKFQQWSHMDYAEVIERVYRQPLANTFLASVATFVGERLVELKKETGEESVEFQLLSDMVKEVYQTFCQNILSYYSKNGSASSSPSPISVGFVGSIAYYFQDYISSALQENGFAMGEVMKSPMEGLMKFHRTF